MFCKNMTNERIHSDDNFKEFVLERFFSSTIFDSAMKEFLQRYGEQLEESYDTDENFNHQ